jgi:hypothetical protein
MPRIAVTHRWLLTRLIPVLFAFMLALTMPLTGHAKVTACRGDPILTLGPWQIQSVIEIDAPIESIDRVEYVYYIPRTTGVEVFYDDTPLAAKEQVQIIQQSGLLAVRVEVKVFLASGVAPVAVTTSTTFTNSSTGRVTTRTASGLSGQTLIISAR